MAKSVHVVASKTGCNSRREISAEGEWEMALLEVGLDDKYRLDAKRIFLSGTQALVRLPMLQRERDRAAGPQHRRLHLRLSRLAARHVRPRAVARQILPAAARHRLRSGPQRGSRGDRGVGQPAGRHVPGRQGRWRVRHLVRQGPRRRPLARCAQARQLGRLLAERRRDCACRRRSWLPVLDAGASERAGVCRRADAGGQSGDAAGLSRSRHFGLCAVALLRLLGRLQGDLGDGGKLGLDRQRPRPHQDHYRPTISRCRPAASRIRWPDPPLERRSGCTARRWQAVAAFARANRFDRIVLDSKPARLGIMATGKAYLDLRQALADLGIIGCRGPGAGPAHLQSRADLAAGSKPARAHSPKACRMCWSSRRSAASSRINCMRILYNVDASKRPSVVGKRDESGAVLLPSEGELTPTMVAAAVVARLRRLGHRSPALEQRLAKLEAFDRPADGIGAAKLQRTPYFCSGCPHNTLDQNSRRQPRHGRHRLSRHGAVDPRPPHRDHLAYGRRGRRLDRAGAVHRASSTSSRISATAPTPIPACWRCAPRPPPASTSPTRSSTTTRSR